MQEMASPSELESRVQGCRKRACCAHLEGLLHTFDLQQSIEAATTAAAFLAVPPSRHAALPPHAAADSHRCHRMTPGHPRHREIGRSSTLTQRAAATAGFPPQPPPLPEPRCDSHQFCTAVCVCVHLLISQKHQSLLRAVARRSAGGSRPAPSHASHRRHHGAGGLLLSRRRSRPAPGDNLLSLDLAAAVASGLGHGRVLG